MKKTIQNLLIATILLSTLASCKKLDTPNEEAKQIIGKWDYIANSGGFSGNGGSIRFSTDAWIEITEKGCFISYEGDKKVSKKNIRIQMKNTIYDSNQRPAIVYRNGNFETYQISGDSLYISDEAYDGYSYFFLRK